MHAYINGGYMSTIGLTQWASAIPACGERGLAHMPAIGHMLGMLYGWKCGYKRDMVPTLLPACNGRGFMVGLPASAEVLPWERAVSPEMASIVAAEVACKVLGCESMARANSDMLVFGEGAQKLYMVPVGSVAAMVYRFYITARNPVAICWAVG